MAGRPRKQGLDYFSMDCHMDDKIKLIEAEFGLKGFAIIVKLFQKIYGELGYYCEWNEDTALLFARENLSTCDAANLINEVIAALIRRNIFSEKLYHNYNILTSQGVQKRYLEAVSRRDEVILIKEYLLISVDKNTKNVVLNSINADINSVNADINVQSKVKESKVKERIDIGTCENLFNDFFAAYPKQNNILAAEKEYTIVLRDNPNLSAELLVQASKNYGEAMKILNTDSKFIKDANNFLKDGKYLDYLPENYKKPAVKKEKNKFSNFEQNNYDFDALEKELLSN